MKRLLDIVAATVGLVLLAPVLLAVALAVKSEGTGPVFFRQQRVGRNGRTFRIIKFRTMRAAPAGERQEMTFRPASRVTRVGAFLRRTKLDELPQLFNVLAGSMSLVGPRPEVPSYVALYSARDRAIVLAVRPGITDLASLRFRKEGEYLAREADPERAYVDKILPRKLRLGRYYVRHQSLCFDLSLILMTISTMLGGKFDELSLGAGGRPRR